MITMTMIMTTTIISMTMVAGAAMIMSTRR